ncbi:MAG: signal peptidase I [Acidimicrobiales bacterium]|nr:signal peptidase I [Acidimicrobiales bacterium]MCB1014416.1 signal peptidase I [Acidimicrobiales bacterium]MCB9373855.1 signal peptidase I [Microthrixaceae bacterium]
MESDVATIDPAGLAGGTTTGGGRTGQRSLLSRAAPLAGLVCWLYLSIVACLVVWVIVVRLLVGWSPMVIATGSMQPSINPGDIIMSGEPEDGGRGLEVGTVITFPDPVRPGGLLTHRITGVNEDGTYETRGDANAVADSYEVEPAEIRGVGRLLVPAVGLPRIWLQEGDLLPLGIWALGTLLAVWAAFRPARKPSDG